MKTLYFKIEPNKMYRLIQNDILSGMFSLLTIIK